MKTDPPSKKTTVIVNGQPVQSPRNYRVYNTATLLDGQGRVKGMYNKTFLLAFGEYIPFAKYFPQVYDMLPAASEFSPGETIEVFELGEHRLGLMICYEDIIPAFGRKVAALDPHVIINVTNDAWFGKTSEPYLHLALATFRTVETRKWLLRSTNTGVSAFVDATGKIVAQTSIYDPEAIAYDVPMMTGPPTLYVRIGDVVGYLGLLGIFVLLGMAWRRKPEDEQGETLPG
jgi:apolipoprotein N-acyltransferase